MRRRLIALLVTTIVVGFVGNVGVARSQPQNADRDRALSLFRESDAHYKRGEFEAAAQLLREAYSLYPEPLLLYNLARALEGTGEYEEAVAQYQRYLDEATDVPDRGAIERRIATLKAQLAARSTPDRPVSGSPDSHPEPAMRRPAPPPDIVPRAPEVQDGPRRLPWLIAGGGVAILGTGVAFGYLSQARHDDAVAEPVQVEAAELQDQARSYARISTAALIGGGLITAAGVTWAVIDRRRDRSSARIAVGVASVQVSWSFE